MKARLMKKILFSLLSLASLSLTGCLSPLEQAYLDCKNTGAKQISNSESNTNFYSGLFSGSNTSTQGRVYDCATVLSRKDVRKSLKEQNYIQ